MYNVHLLPALFGDSILIEYGQVPNLNYILIDGGPYYGYNDLMEALRQVAPNLKKLELLVVTHIDIDHIDGIIKLLNQNPLPLQIQEIWFNGFRQLTSEYVQRDLLGPLQGEYLSKLIEHHQIPHNVSFDTGGVFVNDLAEFPVIPTRGGFEITLLTPSKIALQKLRSNWKKEVEKIEKKESIEEKWENDTRYQISIDSTLGGTGDSSIANASSIAFIGSYEKKECLFAGDAATAELLPGIQSLLHKSGQRRLKLEGWKLAHHGSMHSTSGELMKLIDARHIMVSTNGERYCHPDQECIDAVLRFSTPGVAIYFNYQNAQNCHWNSTNTQYTANYPMEWRGVTIRL